MLTADQPPADRTLAQICKALGNPVRVQIMRYVLEHPGCIGNQILLHLPADAPHAQSTISQHLRVLRAVGLLDSHGEGPAVAYYANSERLAWLREALATW
jgi:ArsR family transcriptional regulator, arsenate/arsenite/antimonite-responsive transcriptional repressor